MKRILPLLLALALLLSACATTPKAPGEAAKLSPEEWATAYTAAIQGARDDEMNDAFPVSTNATGFGNEAIEDMTFTVLGFTKEDTECYAVSMSLMIVSAYAIVAVRPAEGKEETVKTGLENYIDSQKASFENYLEDQHTIAASAKLDTLDDGTILLVMAEGQNELFDSIKTAVAA